MKESTTSPPTLTLGPPAAANSSPIDTATLELLASWRLQDATTDPEPIRAAEIEIEEFKKAMNENRMAAGEPILYP